MSKELEVQLEPDLILDEEIGGASAARQKIIDQINNFKPDEFDETPWTNPRKIRPLPKQEAFMLSEAQVTFYGGLIAGPFIQ